MRKGVRPRVEPIDEQVIGVEPAVRFDHLDVHVRNLGGGQAVH
jgi:hypothetical protein